MGSGARAFRIFRGEFSDCSESRTSATGAIISNLFGIGGICFPWNFEVMAPVPEIQIPSGSIFEFQLYRFAVLPF
jgi:hypothetical protein